MSRGQYGELFPSLLKNSVPAPSLNTDEPIRISVQIMVFVIER